MLRTAVPFVIALGLVASTTACSIEGASDASGGFGDGKADGIGEESTASLYRAGNRYGWGGDDPFVDDVLPVFAKRCAPCHGCVDSPCQLKLTSYEGIARGANVQNIFQTRVFATAQTRLQDGRVTDDQGLVDYAASKAEFRELGFYSVVDHGARSPMYALLDDAHALTPPGALGAASELFDEGMRDRKFVCLGPDAAGPSGPDPEALVGRAMPLGCPRLSDRDFEVLAAWLEDGAYGPSRAADALLATPMHADVVARWEQFLNGDGDQQRLAARYLYEHLFSARLHFPESPGEFYELVRSWTAPGRPIVEVVTELVNDDPTLAQRPAPAGADGDRIYYRLRKYTALIVEKNHITWQLDDASMARWRELLFDSDWGPVAIEPARYDSYNPFEYFAAIPSQARARFMIESSLHIIDTMVRGDVCTGSTATWAIRDHFWVWFLDPAADPSAHDPRLGMPDYDHLVPGAAGGSARRERDYLEAFERQLRALRPNGLSLDDLWDGDGVDANAMVTVLRHGKSATTEPRGFGGRPETYWIVSYANFERLYYTLVVSFDPWGSLLHRMNTWEHMSLIRADGEDLFLSLLPEAHRQTVRDEWTAGFGRLYDELFFDAVSEGRPSRVQVNDARPVQDLVDQIVEHLAPAVTGPPDPLNRASAPFEPLPSSIVTQAGFEEGLATLTGWRAPFAPYLPNVTVIRFGGQGGSVYTLLANRGYQYHNVVLFEEPARNPDKDTLSVARGLVGSYPELFIDVPVAGALDFLRDLRAVDSQRAWEALAFERGAEPAPGRAHFIRRDSPELWQMLDWLHDWHVRREPVEAGLLDISEYIWPETVYGGTPQSDDGYEPNDYDDQATPLSFGVHRMVLCADDDWLAFDVPGEGTLAIEVAFDRDRADIDARLYGPDVSETSATWLRSYEAFAVPVAPGRYQLRVNHPFSSTCQHYTVAAAFSE